EGWGYDRSREVDQEVRWEGGRRGCLLPLRARIRDRFPRPQRGGEDDDDEDDLWVRQTGLRHFLGAGRRVPATAQPGAAGRGAARRLRPAWGAARPRGAGDLRPDDGGRGGPRRRPARTGRAGAFGRPQAGAPVLARDAP